MERAEAGPKTISASNRAVPIPMICIDLLCCILLSLCFGYCMLLIMYSNLFGTRDTSFQEFW